jgi:DNA-directed RNA polymerase subunit H
MAKSVKKSKSKKVSKVNEPKKSLRELSEIDITKHYLVPKHVILSEEEKKELLEKYKVSLSDLPKIKISDLALKNLNVKPGDVVKIIRNNPWIGEEIYYRVVVED